MPSTTRLRGRIRRLVRRQERGFAGNARPRAVARALGPFLAVHPIRFVDIGARGGVVPELRPVAGVLDYVAAEPDPVEAAALRQRLRAQGVRSALVVEAAIGPVEGTGTIHLTADRGGSSLLRPLPEVYEEFGHGAAALVEDTVAVPMRRLESVLDELGVATVDALKVDTQGTELDVLRSTGERRLAGLLFVEAEVEFRPLYAGQSLFRDLDAWICARGFQLFNLNRVFWNFGEGRWRPYGRGQLVHGDVHYLRTDWTGLAPRRLARLAAIALLYGYADYSRFVYERNRGAFEALEPEFRDRFASVLGRRTQRPLERARTVANLFADRALSAYLALRRWNGLAADSDRNYPIR